MNARAEDSLLQCLLALCRYHGNASTAEALTSGLPLKDGKLTPRLFSRAAQRMGLVTRIVNKSIKDLTPALLPAVVLTTDDNALILLGWNETDGKARVVHPDINDTVVDMPREYLLEKESGQIIICRPRFRFDKRVPRVRDSSRGHWFWDAIKANRPVYRDVMIAAFLINLFGLAMPLYFRNVFDRVVPNHALETLWVLTSGVALVFVFTFILNGLRAYFIDIANRRVDIQLSSQIMEQVLGIRLEARPTSVGSYAVHLRSFETLRDFIASSTVTALIDLPFAVLFMLVIGLIAWPIMLCLLMGVVAILIYGYIIQEKMGDVSETAYRSSALRNSTLIESLVGLETIKAMGAESRIQRRWEDSTSFIAHTGVQQRMLSNSMSHFIGFAQSMTRLAVVVMGVYLIIAGQLTLGALIACHLLGTRALAPFARVAGLLLHYNQAKISLATLDGIMSQPTERPEGAQFLSREVFKGDIEFKNVSFAYPGSDMPALTNVSFCIKAGEHVAVLGRVGSGKSTIQKLCMGLYQPTSGSILIDGIDMRQLDPGEYRACVGYVPQDVTLFYGSLRENLCLAESGAADVDLLHAARIANLSEFINRHPQGIDMPIGERGESLSGGQRKSVALARALVHKPPIVLMDEPSGSMDNSTEKTVKRRLERFLRGRTFLVVTHRTSMLDLVDKIIVMDDGKLVADGSKDQVMQALKQGKIGKA